MIPKIITSMWLGDAMPAILHDCVKTHNAQPGFQHHWVTNADYYRDSRYVNECIEARKFAKASDYLRMYYLEQHGGIYLDADTTIIKPLDRFLEHTIFACEEENYFVANGIVGVVPHHPLVQHYLKTVEENFRGGGDLVFQPGMYLWTELVKHSQWSRDVTLYPQEWFLPYNWQTGITKMTENTHTTHLYLKSWL